jgi:hypothetical protein
MSKDEYGTVRVLRITNDNQVAAISNLYAVFSSAGAALPPVRLVLYDVREVGMSYEIARLARRVQLPAGNGSPPSSPASPRDWSGHELALLLGVKPRNMLTQLGEWARLGFFARTGFGTYKLNTAPENTPSTNPPDP